MEKPPIDSLQALHQLLPKIIDELNASPELALAATANPLHAMEELGYRIDPGARPEIEDHVRFKPQAAQRLTALRNQIYQLAKRSFDLNAPHELHQILCEELKVSFAEALPPEVIQSVTPLPQGEDRSSTHPDPLEKYRDQHPIMEPLLEYRCLEASSPRLADLEMYREIRNGNRPTAITRARGSLKRKTE